MQVRFEELQRHLATELLPAYLVCGDEPLMVAEAADAIRRKARAAGFGEREVFFAERGFDWNALRTAGQSLSLFAARRILEVKMPGGKPGVEGGRALTELIERPPPDALLLIITEQLDRDALKSSWVEAMASAGGLLRVWPVTIDALPRWITARMTAAGLKPVAQAAQVLAERVEGNLLAAHQEIEKLALLYPQGTIDEAAVAYAVANSARYDIFQLSEAALCGDAPRALRILAGLRSEGTEPPLILWALHRDLQVLWQSVMRVRTGETGVRTGPPTRQRASQALARAQSRASRALVNGLLRTCTRIDRIIKGQADGDPWDALARLTALLAGVSTPALDRAG